MSPLHFPASTKPADLTVIGKRPATASVPGKLTKGAGRVWGFVVLPLVAWIPFALLMYAAFYGARP